MLAKVFLWCQLLVKVATLAEFLNVECQIATDPRESPSTDIFEKQEKHQPAI